MAAELDDRRLVVLVVQREREDDPDRRNEGEHCHEGEDLCSAPMRNATFPKFLMEKFQIFNEKTVSVKKSCEVSSTNPL